MMIRASEPPTKQRRFTIDAVDIADFMLPFL
jgi:hypothetical protein